jgi:hypothetical protein
MPRGGASEGSGTFHGEMTKVSDLLAPGILAR